MAPNGLFCADVSLSSYSLTWRADDHC